MDILYDIQQKTLREALKNGVNNRCLSVNLTKSEIVLFTKCYKLMGSNP